MSTAYFEMCPLQPPFGLYALLCSYELGCLLLTLATVVCGEAPVPFPAFSDLGNPGAGTLFGKPDHFKFFAVGDSKCRRSPIFQVLVLATPYLFIGV